MTLRSYSNARGAATGWLVTTIAAAGIGVAVSAGGSSWIATTAVLLAVGIALGKAWPVLLSSTVILLVVSEAGVLSNTLPPALPFMSAAMLLAYTAANVRHGDWTIATRRHRGFVSAVSVFLVFAYVSALWSVDPYASATQAAAATTILGVPVVASFSRWRVRASLVADLVLIYWLLVGAVVVGFVWSPQDPNAVVRFGGVFANPNSMASIAALAFGLGFGLPRDRWRALYAPSQMVLLAAIVASQSRTGLTAAAVCGVWLVLRRGAGRTRMVLLVIVVPVLIMSLPGTLAGSARTTGVEALKRLTSAEPDGVTYLSSREDIWRESLTIWTGSPIVGYGYRASEKLFEQRRGLGSLAGLNAQSAHNGIMQILVELGIVGLVVLSAVLVTALRAPPPHDPDHEWLWTGVTAAAIAGLATQATRSSILAVGSVFAFALWMVIAASLAVADDRGAAGSVRPGCVLRRMSPPRKMWSSGTRA